MSYLLRMLGLEKLRRELGMMVALIVMSGGLWLSNPDFLSPSNVFNTTRQIAMLGIFSIGMSFVIITGGIDLSVGSIVGLTGVLSAKIWLSGQPMWLAIICAVLVALTIGLIQGLLISRLGLQPFIVTLIFMLMIRGVSQTVAHGGTLSLGESSIRNLSDSGLLMIHGSPLVPYPVLLFILVIVAATFVLHFSVFGRYLYAIGGNRAAAEYSGINVRKVETITYVISAGLSALAGICYAAYIGQMSQQVGLAYELFAIAAVVLGGCSLRGGEGTILGVVIGTAMLRVIENGFTMFQFRYRDGAGRARIWRLDDNWYFWVMGAVILVAVILDQVVHLMQERKRTRQAGQTGPPPPQGFAVVAAQPQVEQK